MQFLMSEQKNVFVYFMNTTGYFSYEVTKRRKHSGLL